MVSVACIYFTDSDNTSEIGKPRIGRGHSCASTQCLLEIFSVLVKPCHTTCGSFFPCGSPLLSFCLSTKDFPAMNNILHLF